MLVLNVSAKCIFFLTSELVDDAFCSQLHVLVDMHKDQLRQAFSCHDVTEIILVTLNDRFVEEVKTDTSSVTTAVYMLEYRTGLNSCIVSSIVFGFSATFTTSHLAFADHLACRLEIPRTAGQFSPQSDSPAVVVWGTGPVIHPLSWCGVQGR